MIKKIKSSLSAKVFLWIAVLLLLCSFFVYGTVMFFLPKSYTIIAKNQVSDEIMELSDTLSRTDYANADKVISKFCQSNHAVALLEHGGKNVMFGTEDDIDEKKAAQGELLTTALQVTFRDTAQIYTLSITASVSARQELSMAFLKLLPLLTGIILIISTVGAFLCSRALVTPVLEISSISSRMADLDMTWDCKLNRTDELGVLADSLNTMAHKLDAAMKRLANANQRLTEDMEHINRLSGQRRDFFAAASHELKTPLTILKGQIESMIMEIGGYRDTKKVLPETLKEVENMERLVTEILTISRIEIDGFTENREPVILTALVKKVIETLLPLANERRIAVRQNIEGNAVISGNAPLLEKALHNIVSNAIRHSPEGAKVSVFLSQSQLLVRNTGVTIPANELPMLFTPFYRVEKSRNKTTGGSGLGLYLVKSILDLHGLEYEIANADNGVCFFLSLHQKI